MLMLGKMSVGVRSAEATPKIMISNAITTKVYGRRSASLTMPTMCSSSWTGGLPLQALGPVLQDRSKPSEGSIRKRGVVPRRDGGLWDGVYRVRPREEPGDDIRAAEANIGERMVVQSQQIGIGLFTVPLRKCFPNSDNEIDQRHDWLPDRVLGRYDLMT